MSLDFMLGLLRTRIGQASTLVMVNMFSKTTHFIACKKTDEAGLFAHLFFQEVVRLHGVSKTITSNENVKFISKFCNISG